MKRKMIGLLLGLLCLTALSGIAFAATTTVPLDVTGIGCSGSSYTNNMDKTWTLSYPGAESITMTFASWTAFENNYDFLYIGKSKTDGTKYTGTTLAGMTVTVSGDTAVLRMTTDGSQTSKGFEVTSAYATVPYVPESVITVVDAENGEIALSAYYGDFGDTVEIYAHPAVGYKVAGIYVDGEEVDGSFTLTKAEHIVTAEFEQIFPGKEANAFGSCGSNLEWIYFDNGTLYISGSGAMTNSNSAPWKAYAADITTLILEPGMTNIGTYAFQNCTGLTEVEIPEGVTIIGAYAFSGCSALESVTIPVGVETDRKSVV